MPAKHTIDVYMVSGNDHRKADLEKLPDLCPVCGRGMRPDVVSSGYARNQNWAEVNVQVCFRCTFDDCRAVFLAYYRSYRNDYNTVHLSRTAPSAVPAFSPPPLVDKVSPSFGSIYNQALAAQSYGLKDIAGPGFRKSLEFLLKEFLLAEPEVKDNTKEEQEVRKLMLGPLIKEKVQDQNIKDVAEVATWMGNDETHFERRWESQDIEDLKDAIKLAVNWIDNMLRTRELLAKKAAHQATST